MITHYYRPETIEETISLLSNPYNRPLGGGVYLNQPSDNSFAVVDLQFLGLSYIQKVKDSLEVGATTTLESILQNPHAPDGLRYALQHDLPLNLRNMATIGGAVSCSGGRSPFLVTLLALDPILILAPGEKEVRLGDLLPIRGELLAGKLITKVLFALNCNLQYEFIARSPSDKPILCTALARWSSGRTRVVFGGWGSIPTIALDGKLDEKEAREVLKLISYQATRHSTDDWASEDYRQGIAGALTLRCWERSLI